MQIDIFELVGAPLVENCLAGFNSSVFAYGQVPKLVSVVSPIPQKYYILTVKNVYNCCTRRGVERHTLCGVLHMLWERIVR